MPSRHHGSGMIAGDARAYVPGDDPRLMDWALLARTTHAYVRPPQHEPDEGVAIVIDASTPMAFGDDTSKLLWAAEWACWLSAWLESQQYRYDVLLWQPGMASHDWHHWRQQKTRQPQPLLALPALIKWLYQHLQQAEVNGWQSNTMPDVPWFPLATLQSVLKPYRHGVVLSDFAPHMNAQTDTAPIHAWLDTLGPLCRRHRWQLVQVQHPMETQLSPQLARLPLKPMGIEANSPVISSAGLGGDLIATFNAQQQERQQTLITACQSAGITVTRTRTDESPMNALLPVLEWLR